MVSPLSVDLYEEDLHGHPGMQAYFRAGLPWAIVGLKATEGDYYPRDPTWFHTTYPLVKECAGDRWGDTAFRWAYHYFRVDRDPIKQADLHMGLVDSAGGQGLGDLRAVVDVESSEQPKNATAQQVIDGVTKFAERIKTRQGRAPILYAGSYIRALKITDHMGCEFLMTAAYGSSLPSRLYTEMGWPIDKLLGWQYQGTEGYSGPKNYPRECPMGPGPLDLTAITICDGVAPEQQLAWLRLDCRIH
jgi:hypothetical protein